MHSNDQPPPDHDRTQNRAEHLERLYQDHLAREGHNAWNDNPDGCWYCGSPSHHSTECTNRTPHDDWWHP